VVERKARIDWLYELASPMPSGHDRCLASSTNPTNNPSTDPYGRKSGCNQGCSDYNNNNDYNHNHVASSYNYCADNYNYNDSADYNSNGRSSAFRYHGKRRRVQL
jgi:hypothetical protein